MNKYSPSTTWAHYSMIKSVIKIKENIDIQNYYSVIAILKRNSEGFRSKKAFTFTDAQIKMFIDEAPDEIFLVDKVTKHKKTYIFINLQN